ncbi:hypothetical protein HRW18_05495 [Streptomyces lunaelactis]|uniref:hypothetical protein n=1 Tax=Streptomyces lunaelactis TaxID=1535768 RepID=UPI00158595F9|nr:hypothetical protein [Streptomyces lunaelactis]NUK07477.1 hypothetical protein [Streptomyces lunaelactis]
MTSKPRLTEEQHAELGRKLAAMQSQLVSIHVQLLNAYPMQGAESRPARKIDAAAKKLEDARSELENALFRDHPNATTGVYYPKN